MLDPTGLYESSRLAAGYAFARPPVHVRVMELAARRLGLTGPVSRALDIGCGAGLSTAALDLLAAHVVGLEPSRVMLQHCGTTAPRAAFVNARAEDLPFRAGAFDLVTAAGALNYVDLGRVLPGVARVLSSEGSLVIYDFSSGRRARGDDGRLAAWFEAFEQRYPFPPGYALDVCAIDYASAGLRLAEYERFEVGVTVTPEAYLAYVLTESNVELAVAAGTPEPAIRDWCAAGLAPVFAGRALEILFEGYICRVRRLAHRGNASPTPSIPGRRG